jgi:hypothetical protein
MAKTNPDYSRNLVLPDATSGWSHIKTPDTGGTKKNGVKFTKNATWDIEVVVGTDPAWDAIIQELTDFENSRLRAYGLPEVAVTSVIKKDRDGNRVLKPFSKDSSKFVLVNPDKTPYTDDIWKGSKVSVAVTPKFSDLKNTLVLYLVGIMVLERPEPTSGGGNIRDPFAARAPAAPAAPVPDEQPPFTADPFAGVR